MSICVYSVSNVAVTTSTGIGCITAFGTSGCCYNTVVAMALGINHILCNKNIITNRTMLTLGKTGFGTGRSHCRVNNPSVSGCLKIFCAYLSANLTSIGRQTRLGTSRFICHNVVIVINTDSNLVFLVNPVHAIAYAIRPTRLNIRSLIAIA